jgi:hypothetical protein
MYFTESAEYLFASEALKLGFLPLWPSTEAVPFDMQLLKDGRTTTIQVKTCRRATRGAYRAGIKRAASRKGGRAYKISDVDFVAVYCMADEAWYIFPTSLVRLEMRLKPFELASCKYKAYYEAWDLLEAKP